MPVHESTILPDGWQVVQRSDGWWLQRRLPGTEFWLDAFGPAKQRIQAVRVYERRNQPPPEQGEERDDGDDTL